jgi:hypothetical protein
MGLFISNRPEPNDVTLTLLSEGASMQKLKKRKKKHLEAKNAENSLSFFQFETQTIDADFDDENKTFERFKKKMISEIDFSNDRDTCSTGKRQTRERTHPFPIFDRNETERTFLVHSAHVRDRHSLSPSRCHRRPIPALSYRWV